MDRRQLQSATKAAGERLMAFVRDDPGIVAILAKGHVDAALATGELVRGEDLRAGAYEMVPIGRVEQLELAIDAALDELVKGNIRAAVEHLESTFPPEPAENLDDDLVDAEVVGEEPEVDLSRPALGPGEGSDEGDVDDPPEPERRRLRPRPPEAEEDDSDPGGRPSGMPRLDETYECTGLDLEDNPCGAVVPGQKAQFAWTRFQKVLCPGCLANYNAASGRVDPGAADDDDDVD